MELPLDLRTGFGRLDEQHLAMLQVTENILDGAKDGDWESSLFNCLSALKEYTSLHFDIEQELMGEYHYPHRREHEAQHSAFRTELEEIEKEVRRFGASADLAEHTRRVLIDVLMRHIRDHDLKMAAYLKERMS